MRSVVFVGILASALFVAASPVQAAYVTGCCACLPGPNFNAGSAEGGSATDALFCGLVEGMGYPEFVQSCDAQGGTATVECPAPTDGAGSCPAVLRLEGIACPGAASAPTASPWMLAVLASLLGAAGAVVLRRRRA